MTNKQQIIKESNNIIDEVQDILTRYAFALRDKVSLQIVKHTYEREEEIDKLKDEILRTKSLLVQHQVIALQLGW